LFPNNTSGDISPQDLRDFLVSAVPTGRGSTKVVASLDAVTANPALVGQVDHVCDGTADDVQIQLAIDALSTYGGIVMLTEGSFDIRATIKVRSLVRLTGQGRATILKVAPSDTYDTMDVIQLYDIEQHNVELDHFEISGRRAAQGASGQHGIYLDNTDSTTTPPNKTISHFIHDIIIDRVKGHGIYLKGYGSAGAETHHRLYNILVHTVNKTSYYIDTSDSFFVHCHSAKPGENGWIISGPSNQLSNCKGSLAGQLTIEDEDDTACTLGFNFSLRARQISLANCRSEAGGGGGFEVAGPDAQLTCCRPHSSGEAGDRRAGFHIKTIGGVEATSGHRCVMSGCWSGNRNTEAGTARIQEYGLRVGAGVQDALWSGGTLSRNFGSDGNSYDGAYLDAGTRTRILAAKIVEEKNDETRVERPVESGGAAPTIADGGTITHGMFTTPTYVVAIPSVAGEFVSVTAKGATTFTVAIKKHDGSAGTTQTIYWRAWA
jgi:hypothetical protein